MKNTIKAVLIAALAAALMAEEPTKPKAPEPKSVALSESQILKIENVTLKQALQEQQAKALADQQNTLVKEICGEAKIDVKVCSIDIQAKIVRENVPPAAPKK